MIEIDMFLLVSNIIDSNRSLLVFIIDEINFFCYTLVYFIIFKNFKNIPISKYKKFK